MQLQIKRNLATFLELRDATPVELETEGYELHFRTSFPEGSNRNFVVEFKLSVAVGGSHFLTAQYASHFETDSDFDEEFKESAFVKVNAPAIAFPFIRSYIAHITLIAGFESVILPSVNFTVPR